jgi:hypothetical protein
MDLNPKAKSREMFYSIPLGCVWILGLDLDFKSIDLKCLDSKSIDFKISCLDPFIQGRI